MIEAEDLGWAVTAAINAQCGGRCLHHPPNQCGDRASPRPYRREVARSNHVICKPGPGTGDRVVRAVVRFAAYVGPFNRSAHHIRLPLKPRATREQDAGLVA